MPRFKFEDCTSKQFVRENAWIPQGRVRLRRIITSAKKGASRRLRYLTFCGERALDVIALRDAKIIKQSSEGLFDTVTFFDFAPQAVDQTQQIIEGANGFAADFFGLMSLPYEDLQDGAADDTEPPAAKEEGTATFLTEQDQYLYGAFQRAFPFDLINLDVERYVVIPSEQVPGKLLNAWDKLLQWQKRKGKGARREIEIDQFTLFFTTRIGPKNLPEPHRSQFINVVGANVGRMPELARILRDRFAVDTAEALYTSQFEEFLKLAVPKALISRAVVHDWALDPELSYQAFEFDRAPATGQPYTMLHFVLHFRRCSPSITAQMNPEPMPEATKVAYQESVKRIFLTESVDVDASKAGKERELQNNLRRLGVEITTAPTSPPS